MTFQSHSWCLRGGACGEQDVLSSMLLKFVKPSVTCRAIKINLEQIIQHFHLILIALSSSLSLVLRLCVLHVAPVAEQHDCMFDHLGQGREEAVLKMVKLDRKVGRTCQRNWRGVLLNAPLHTHTHTHSQTHTTYPPTTRLTHLLVASFFPPTHLRGPTPCLTSDLWPLSVASCSSHTCDPHSLNFLLSVPPHTSKRRSAGQTNLAVCTLETALISEAVIDSRGNTSIDRDLWELLLRTFWWQTPT